MRVLIVEDEPNLGQQLKSTLEGAGYAIDLATDGEEGHFLGSTESYDAIVLDLGLPDGDGTDWLTSRRKYHEMPPAIMLTARGALEDRITGLDAGADDYLVKPVEIDELAARIRALLRRPGVRIQPVIEVGRLYFDVANRTARAGDQEIDLSRREADLLELLMRHAVRGDNYDGRLSGNYDGR